MLIIELPRTFSPAALVLGASNLGVPVSTTHVSCSSTFGIAAVNGRRQWQTVRHILLTWLTTLPMGCAIGAIAYAVLCCQHDTSGDSHRSRVVLKPKPGLRAQPPGTEQCQEINHIDNQVIIEILITSVRA